MMRVQNDLDETKIVLASYLSILIMYIIRYLNDQHETIDAVLQRGEKLDNLVAKTDKLSTTSKAFYKEVCKPVLLLFYM